MFDANDFLGKELKAHIGLPVAQDIYTGKEPSFFEFTYEDERPIAWGDNKPDYDNTFILLKLVTPREVDYMGYKQKTVRFLEENGFRVTSNRSYLEPTSDNRKRVTAFNLEKLSKH